MKIKYNVTIDNSLVGYADIVNYNNHLLVNIERIKREKCFIFVIDCSYNNTKVKVLTMAQFHIDEHDNLELVNNHILKFRLFKNDYYNKSKIDNIGFVYKKVIRKLKRNKINIYYVKRRYDYIEEH